MLRWQFSIRGLLVATAFVSLVLAVAVRLPTFFTVCLVAAVPTLLLIAILHSANFATSDHRPRSAFITWIVLAMFFGCYSYAILRTSILGNDVDLGFGIFGLAVMSMCMVASLIQARKSWKLTQHSLRPPDSVLDDCSDSLPTSNVDDST